MYDLPFQEEKGTHGFDHRHENVAHVASGRCRRSRMAGFRTIEVAQGAFVSATNAFEKPAGRLRWTMIRVAMDLTWFIGLAGSTPGTTVSSKAHSINVSLGDQHDACHCGRPIFEERSRKVCAEPSSRREMCANQELGGIGIPPTTYAA
jgi:hypothetical protein